MARIIQIKPTPITPDNEINNLKTPYPESGLWYEMKNHY